MKTVCARDRRLDYMACLDSWHPELHAVQGDLNSALKACSELQREREDLISRIDRLSHQIDRSVPTCNHDPEWHLTMSM